MARRKGHRAEEQLAELNLAPIMNMVMILIPLLLLSTVFMKTGVVNISSPRNAQANQPETEENPEETPVPRVVVYISDDGFRIGDQRNLPEFQQYTTPIARCGGAGAGAAPGAPGQPLQPHDMAEVPPTVCALDGVDASAELVERLDFAGLYNQLVRVRLEPLWFDRFGEENNSVVSILGDPEVPFEVLVKTMDTARYVLAPSGTDPGAPTASSNIEAYLLGAGSPSLEDLENAPYLKVGPEGRQLVELFPDPVLLLPRPGAGG